MSLTDAAPTTGEHPAFHHRALFHRGADDLVARVGPELAAALDRNEPVHLSLTEVEMVAMRDHIGPALDAAIVLPAADRYVTPGRAMAEVQRFAQQALEQGVAAAWSVGSVQVEGDPRRDQRWARYETAVDQVLCHTPLRGICVYDLQEADEILDLVRGCHAHLDHPDHGAHPSPDLAPYDHAQARWRHRALPPRIDLQVDRPDQARGQLQASFGDLFTRERMDDLLLVATELVTNGMRHGDGPVTLRSWDLDREVVLEVSDHGSGIADPFADLRPQRGGLNGGFGMWLVGQLCDQVSIGREDDRTVVVAVLDHRIG